MKRRISELVVDEGGDAVGALGVDDEQDEGEGHAIGRRGQALGRASQGRQATGGNRVHQQAHGDQQGCERRQQTDRPVVAGEGREHLAANKAAVDAILARMQEAGSAYGGGAPQILRAMENFKAALRLRLARGPLSDEEIKAIAAELDGAAQRIEQI